MSPRRRDGPLRRGPCCASLVPTHDQTGTISAMRLLVLGGTSFVGGAVVDAALERGWSVTTFNRGTRHELRSGVQHVVGDRTRPYDVAALGSGRWDVAVDTWAAAPVVVRTSAELLSDVVGRYVYVSSRAVYAMPYPAGLDESAPTVAAAAGAPSVGYSEDKRGGELAVEEVFGEQGPAGPVRRHPRPGGELGPDALLARARGPQRHRARSGRPRPAVALHRCPRPRRLDAAGGTAGARGAYNLVNPPGHATTGAFLDACRRAVGAPPASGGRAPPRWPSGRRPVDRAAGLDPAGAGSCRPAHHRRRPGARRRPALPPRPGDRRGHPRVAAGHRRPRSQPRARR